MVVAIIKENTGLQEKRHDYSYFETNQRFNYNTQAFSRKRERTSKWMKTLNFEEKSKEKENPQFCSRFTGDEIFFVKTL